MRLIKDECIGCYGELGCLGSACSYRNVEHIYCDKCNKELAKDEVYEIDGKDLCEDCVYYITNKQIEEAVDTILATFGKEINNESQL